MSFDTIYFDRLIRRSKALSTPHHSKTQPTYSLPILSELDILELRWYIRGINAAGDFCFIIPGTVNFQLKQKRRKIDFQMQADGTLSKIMFDEGQLVFQFVRGDGSCSQWNQVLKSCKTPVLACMHDYVHSKWCTLKYSLDDMSGHSHVMSCHV